MAIGDAETARRQLRETNRIAKLSAPRGAGLLRRERVATAIEAAMASGLCWVAAPAGYGKTSAIIDYLQSRDVAHVWLRVDEGDQDIARFFHYLGQTLGTEANLPVFGIEYAERPEAFARRFFRAYFESLPPGTILVLDDLHDADTAEFRAMLAAMVRELPPVQSCICASRTLPRDELADLALKGQIGVVDRAALEFSPQEARALLALRTEDAEGLDVEMAHGWAVGLVLLADRGKAAELIDTAGMGDVVSRHFFGTLPSADQDMLLQLNLLPEISAELADAMVGSQEAGRLLDRLYQRQLLITRSQSGGVFVLHDLLREVLERHFERRLPAGEKAALRRQAAEILIEAGRPDEAIPLALMAEDWPMASQLILSQAEPVLAEGRRATVIDWMGRLPASLLGGWHFYWLGIAHMPDDAAAEAWLSRAWDSFKAVGDLRGLCLTAAQAVLVKTDSWRTYEGLSAWTRRAFELIERGIPDLPAREAMLVRIGMVRALNFADDYYSDSPAGARLEAELLERLVRNRHGDPSGLRLMASETLIEHSVTVMRADLFTQAVDSVIEDLRNPDVLPWTLGMWLVAFGAKSGRYFPYQRRNFPYASAEAALRAAIALGERESLSSVEFGGLYHLQMQMKFRNDFAEFGQIVGRLADIADSRFTTQVAVVADCHATLHARQGAFGAAYADCKVFMAAIEAANEPMVERWPHYITQFQVLLADRRPAEAAALLAELLPRLDGGALRRTQICILAAEALAGRWSGAEDYAARLRAFLTELAGANWPMVLLNFPELLSELVGDGLERGIEPGFCLRLVAERRLVAPGARPAAWPWPLKIFVLGGFRLERGGMPLALGAKPPTRALDILRALALSRDNMIALETLQDWLWPDLDGDQARAACEQALHRLRKLLGDADLVVQRDGKLRLPADKVWVDLGAWEAGLAAAQNEAEEARLLSGFAGPLLRHERMGFWAVGAAERARRNLIELALRLGRRRQAAGNGEGARAAYRRALELYPDAGVVARALVALDLDLGDVHGALDDYRRYLHAEGDGTALAEIEAMLGPHLARSRG